MAPSVSSAQRSALVAFGVVCLVALVGGRLSQGGVAAVPSQRSEAPPSAEPIAEANVQAPVQAAGVPAPPEAGRAAPEPLVVRVQYGGVDGVSPDCLSELSPIRLDWSDMAQWAQADPRQPEALQLALRAAANQQPITALPAIGAPATDAEHFYTLMRAFLVPESANAIDFEAGLRAIVATEGSPYLAYAAGMLASTGLPLDARVAFIEDRMREASPAVAAEIAWNAACAPETLSALSADALARVEGAVEPGDGAIAVAVGAEWALRGDVARGRALMERGLASLQAQGVGHPQRAEDLRLPSPPDDPNTVGPTGVPAIGRRRGRVARRPAGAAGRRSDRDRHPRGARGLRAGRVWGGRRGASRREPMDGHPPSCRSRATQAGRHLRGMCARQTRRGRHASPSPHDGDRGG